MQWLTFGKSSVVVVEEFLAIERLQTLQDTVTNATGTNGTNDLSFKVEGVSSNLRNVPVSTFAHLDMRYIRREEDRAFETKQTSCAGTKFLTRSSMFIITCSATEVTFDPDTSRTWIFLSTAASRLMWSEPTPAVIQILRFFAFLSSSGVR